MHNTVVIIRDAPTVYPIGSIFMKVVRHTLAGKKIEYFNHAKILPIS